MDDMMAWGAEFLAQSKREHASSLRQVCRPGRPSIEVAFTRGRTTFEQQTEFGVVSVVSEDWICSPEDYRVEAEPGPPMRGDRIVERLGSQQLTYEVLAPGKEPVWRYTDGFRQRIRIHTKLIATETVG